MTNPYDPSPRSDLPEERPNGQKTSGPGGCSMFVIGTVAFMLIAAVIAVKAARR